MGITLMFNENKHKLITLYLNTSFNQKDNLISSLFLQFTSNKELIPLQEICHSLPYFQLS